jgi:hypothetical protein
MADARYFRAQAELCLQLAQQISNQREADNLRAMAARHTARAEALETGAEPPMLSASSPCDESRSACINRTVCDYNQVEGPRRTSLLVKVASCRNGDTRGEGGLRVDVQICCFAGSYFKTK